MFRDDLAPYILHAALLADRDEAAGTYESRPVVEVDVSGGLEGFLEEEARRAGCDPDVLVEAILAQYCARPAER